MRSASLRGRSEVRPPYELLTALSKNTQSPFDWPAGVLANSRRRDLRSAAGQRFDQPEPNLANSRRLDLRLADAEPGLLSTLRRAAIDRVAPRLAGGADPRSPPER